MINLSKAFMVIKSNLSKASCRTFPFHDQHALRQEKVLRLNLTDKLYLTEQFVAFIRVKVKSPQPNKLLLLTAHVNRVLTVDYSVVLDIYRGNASVCHCT